MSKQLSSSPSTAEPESSSVPLTFLESADAPSSESTNSPGISGPHESRSLELESSLTEQNVEPANIPDSFNSKTTNSDEESFSQFLIRLRQSNSLTFYLISRGLGEDTAARLIKAFNIPL